MKIIIIIFIIIIFIIIIRMLILKFHDISSFAVGHQECLFKHNQAGGLEECGVSSISEQNGDIRK